MNVGWLFAAFFAAAGVLFLSGRGENLIPGYAFLPRRDRERINTPALCHFMGKCMFCLAGTIAIGIMGQVRQESWLQSLGIATFLATIAFMLVHSNTANRFRNSPPSECPPKESGKCAEADTTADNPATAVPHKNDAATANDPKHRSQQPIPDEPNYRLTRQSKAARSNARRKKRAK